MLVAVAQPLVAEGAEAVGVGDAGGVGGEDLILGGGAGDADVAGGVVVDVDDRTDGVTGQVSVVLVAIGVADGDRNHWCRRRIARGVGAAGGAGDVGRRCAATGS